MRRLVQCASVLGLLFMVSCGKETPESKVFKKFNSGDAAAKDAALNEMVGFKDQVDRVAPYLVKGMAHSEKNVRLSAVRAASALNASSEAVLKQVQKLASSDSEAEVRGAALECAITVAPDDASTGELIRSALGDENLEVAKEALRVVMPKVGEGVSAKDVAGVLLKAVKDGDARDQTDVVFTLATSFGALGKKAADAAPVLESCAAAAKVDPKVKEVVTVLILVVNGKATADQLNATLNVLMSSGGPGGPEPGPAVGPVPAPAPDE